VPELGDGVARNSLRAWCEFSGQRPGDRTDFGSARPREWPLFMEPEQKWYRTGEIETGVHQFLVQDPDGYLIRFSAGLGERALSDGTGEAGSGATARISD
jgi:hypothetical protein